MQPHPGEQTAPESRRGITLLAVGVICVSVIGYFVGITAPMNPADDAVRPEFPHSQQTHTPADDHVVPATAYDDFSIAALGVNRTWTTRLESLKQIPYDPYAPIEISADDKLAALAERTTLRAYNGAPPTIPHPIDQLSSQSCLACHEQGFQTTSVSSAKMPHALLVNCTQCHVERLATFATASASYENQFEGLPAPLAGPRAFPQAPPVIPHTTWMREKCLSCHGRTGKHGLKTTHAWRHNCQQCHAPSARLEQVKLAESAPFLPPPQVETTDE